MMQRPLVLVAVDDGTDVMRAIDVARRIAKARGADVDVIHVVPDRALSVDARSGSWPVDGHDDGPVSVRSRIASMLRSGDQDGEHARSVTLPGAPEHVVPAYGQLHRATLLVVQRDYGSAAFWRNGRVVNAMVRRSPMPVLVLPTRETRTRREGGLRRILTPVDFSIASAVAMRMAVDLSRRHEASVTLVHAVKGVPQHMVFSGGEAWRVVRRVPAQLEAAATRLRGTAALFGINDVDTEVATGYPGRAILEIASRTDPDLIVMGIPRRTWLDRVVFGSTLRRVLRRATVPVLAVPVVAGGHPWTGEFGIHRIDRRSWAEPAVDRVAA